MFSSEREKEDAGFMRLAIEQALRGIGKGQTPFGACVVKDGKAVVCSHNVVWANTDITAHAEVHAIRQACELLHSIDLSGCTIYSTCEPCPMCFSAIHWARIARIVYGASIADAKEAGFNELDIPNTLLRELAGTGVLIDGGVLRDECAGLFSRWKEHSGHCAY